MSAWDSTQDYSYDRRGLCLTPGAVQSVVSELCVCELFVINPGQYQSDTEMTYRCCWISVLSILWRELVLGTQDPISARDVLGTWQSWPFTTDSLRHTPLSVVRIIRGAASPTRPLWAPWMRIPLPRHDLLGEGRWLISQRRRDKSLFLNGLLLSAICPGIQVKVINHCQAVRIRQ